jgi:hypothetical protein
MVGMMVFCYSREDKFPFSNSFHSSEFVGNRSQSACFTPEHEDLQTEFMRQMHVENRNDQIGVFMLKFEQPIPDLSPLMLVNERERSHDLSSTGFPGLPSEQLANCLADGFASCSKTMPLAIAVELAE